MNDEEILDQLMQLNTTLDDLSERIGLLEKDNPMKAQYFNQMLKSLKKPDCCANEVIP